MRTLGEGLATALASGATTLATCWRIERTDGVVIGLTDHDEALSLDGTSYEPMGEGGEAAQKLGAQVATAELAGVLVSDRISDTDLRLGRYDGAEVETWRVDWRNPANRVLLRRASIGEITAEDGAFRAELRSGQAQLNRVRGRVYQRLCDARLGDARCGVDLDQPAFRGEAEVSVVEDRHHLVVTGLAGFAENWFGFGEALWTSGSRDGLRDAVMSHRRIGGIDRLGFAVPVGDWVAEGDRLTLTAGCDRRLATCRERFGNVVNFRGFPHVPGNDFVLRYPREDNPLDGRALY